MKKIEGYDVVVVGGGPGGVGAAVAAARAGAEVALVERGGFLGGAATAMLVNPFMPHTTDCWQEKGPHKIVNAGTFTEILKTLRERGMCNPNDERRFDDEGLKVVLDEITAKAGVHVLFHTTLFDANVQNGRIKSIHVSHNGGPMEITGKVFIDSSGDGLLAAAAGCQFMFGNEQGNVMPMTLFFALANVDTTNAPPGHEIKKLAATGDKDNPALVNTNVSCTAIPREGVVYFNAIRIPGNTLDVFDVSKAEAEGRRRVQNFVTWIKAKIPAYKDCFLMKTASAIGIRESRRVKGDYILSGDDFKNCARFDDAIACCAYPVDIHGQKQGETRIEYLGEGQFYQIPYRCLTPVGLDNLLMGSRCISADVVAHSSVRIMATVMNMGEAAGFAATLSLPQGNVRTIDIRELQRCIIANGGVLDADKDAAAMAALLMTSARRAASNVKQ